jgi:hypothetical protein
MALNPRGTRQRDGAAQLSQNRQEYRLFDAGSSSTVSPVFEVWNEPVVVHVHGVQVGQGVAIDCVSDYDNNPVYTPFTPIRGQAIILTEDLTSVILFYAGRYVLRLTNGGLGTIRAFAYPFSVSHDWGDYYGGLGFGGNVVTSIDEIDSNTINISLVPDPGVGDVTIRADAILSPDADNILEFRANGMFAQGPDNGSIVVVPTSVLDTTSIDLTLAANVLSAVVIRSPDAGQILELRANGVYVPGPQNGNPIDVPTSVLDTLSVDLTLAANVLSADVIISPNPGNALSILANGLYATGFAGTITSAADTATVDHTVAAGVLTSDVIISPNAGNIITALGNGLYAAGFAGTITSAVDSATIDHTVAAGVLSSVVIRSPDVGNSLELRGNGVYVPTASAGAVTGVADTLSIDLTLGAGILTADLRIDPSVENVLNLGAPGVLVEAATTAEEEAETAGDLVITASVLGHIVNARTAQQCAHLGIGAGALAANQTSVGHGAGSGVVGSSVVSIGRNAGQNIVGPSNIFIGTDANAGSGTGNDNRSFIVRIGSGAISGAGRYENGSVLIGRTYSSVLNSGVHTVVPVVTAIGENAFGALTYDGSSSSFPMLAIGNNAGASARMTNNSGMSVIGAYAGNASRTASVSAVGHFAASNLCNLHTGISPNVDCIGIGAGNSLYTSQVFNDPIVAILCAGSSAATSAKWPSKNYIFDNSKFTTVSPAISEITNPDDGAVTDIAKVSDVSEAIPTNSNPLMCIGAKSGISAHVKHSDIIGFESLAIGYAAASVTLGTYSGRTAAFEDTVAIGLAAGYTTKATKSIFVGNQAGGSGVTAPISANFTGTAFNGTQTITIPTHTLAVGEYHVVTFIVVSGSAPTNLPGGNVIVVYAQSNTTLVHVGGGIAAGAVGTFQFIAMVNQDNCIAIGYQARNQSATNNITLGNDDHSTLNTAAKIYPGTDAGAMQSSAGIMAGTGAPSDVNGNNGDFYLRSDGSPGTLIYHKSGGSWAGIA